MSLTAILTGCGPGDDRQITDEAAAREAAARQAVVVAAQPEECRASWPLLSRDRIVGHEALDGIAAYEHYITGTINPAKQRCWQFNENIRQGLAHPAAGGAR